MKSVDLVVSGVDLTDDAMTEILAEHLDDIAWSSIDERTIATVYLDDAGDAVSCTIDAAHRIEHAIQGAVCERVDEDLVGVSDIAERTGMTREAIRTWTVGLRGPGGFPAARGTVGAGPRPLRVWAWADVVPWLTRHYGLCADEDVLPWRDVVAINSHLQRVDHAIDEEWQRLSQPTHRADVLVGARREAVEPVLVVTWTQTLSTMQDLRWSGRRA